MPKSTKSNRNPLPCPFCARNPVSGMTRYHEPAYKFGCLACGIYFAADRMSDAVRKWNRRKAPRKMSSKQAIKHAAVFTPELDPIQDRFI